MFPVLNVTQLNADFFIQQMKHAVMKVSFAVVKADFNYLLNPFHADFNKIKISSQEDFSI